MLEAGRPALMQLRGAEGSRPVGYLDGSADEVHGSLWCFAFQVSASSRCGLGGPHVGFGFSDAPDHRGIGGPTGAAPTTSGSGGNVLLL